MTQSNLKTAQALLDQGQLLEAEKQFEAILFKDPQSPEALHGLGIIHAQRGQWDKALTHMEAAKKYGRTGGEFYFHLGQVYRKFHRLAEAISSFQEAIKQGYSQVEIHLSLAQLLMMNSEMNQALVQFDLALKLDPSSIATHYQLGLYFLKTHAFEWAQKQFNNVLALYPEHVDALFHLSVTQFHLNHIEAAQKGFEEVLKKEPEYVEAWVNLGAIALKHQAGQQAIHSFTQALTLDSEHEVARSNLAATFMHFSRFENALTHYLILLEHYPNNLDYLYNAGVAEMTLGQLKEAKARFLHILTKQPAHFETLYNLAVLYLRNKEKKQAQAYLIQALGLKSDDPSCLHLLAALKGEHPDPQVSSKYAQFLFEQYASYYDQHLVSTLHYRLPVLVSTLLQQAGLTHQKQTLDLGCGTGLCGEVLRPMTDHLVGVDISEKMIERARVKNCYDECIVQDAVRFLQDTPMQFDLIVAADLFPYLGELSACFEGVKKCLLPGGAFVFTVETTKKAPWQLQETARYAHDVNYIHELCQKQGFEIQKEEIKSARSQGSENIMVSLFLCKKID